MSSDIPGDAVPGGAAVPSRVAPGRAAPGRGRRGGRRGAARRPRQRRRTAPSCAPTVELLAERGLAAMSIEEVAARAGVGKTTIYRRWRSRGLLALDAFVAEFRAEQPLPDTGSLRGDMLAALHAWVRAVTQTPIGPILTGLIAEAQDDPELGAAWRDRVLEPLRAQHRIMLGRHIERGDRSWAPGRGARPALRGRLSPAAARPPADDRPLHPPRWWTIWAAWRGPVRRRPG